MTNRMSLSEACQHMELEKLGAPMGASVYRAARTILAVGDVLDKIRKAHPEMTREQYEYAHPTVREVNNEVREILARLEDALGEES